MRAVDKLLYVTKALPNPKSPEAGYKIAFNVLEHLVRRYDVSMISFTNGPDDVAYAQRFPLTLRQLVTVQSTLSGKLRNVLRRPMKPVLTTLRYDPAFRAQLRKLLLDWRPDVVLTDFTQMARYIVDIRQAAPQAVTLLYEQDVSYQMAHRRALHETGPSRLFWAREAGLLRQDEAFLCNQYDIVCAHTKKDVALLCHLGVAPRRVHRISSFALRTEDTGNWVDPGNSEAPCLLFFGAMSRFENVDAVRRLVTRLLPKLRQWYPAIKVKVVGGGQHHLREEFANDPAVMFTGYVPSILREAEECQLALFPLTFGAGVKIKVLEAMSWGMPVVTTSVGAEGIEAKDGTDMEIAESDDQLVDRVMALMRDPERRSMLGRGGRALCRTEFDITREMGRLDMLIENERARKAPALPERDRGGKEPTT